MTNKPDYFMQIRSRYLMLALASACLITIVSCQREPSVEQEKNTIPSSKDPVALTAAIRVWHGVRTQGVMPGPNGGGLSLNTSNEPVRAFAGRYAIIQPDVLAGNPQGYYIKVNGANQYFKVDYSKPRDIAGRIRPGHKKRNSPFTGSRVDSSGNGNIDSSIVIVLPANLQVPDTFCVTYCAYDASGNISQPVSVCIIVSKLGADASSSWINGEWRFTATWDSYSRDTIIYNRWITLGDEYYCEYDSSTGSSNLTYFPNGTPAIAADSMLFRKANLTLGANGGQRYDEDLSVKLVDIMNSSCSQIIYEPVSSDNYSMNGGWSFNSSTNKITIIFEFDDSGYPVLEAWEYDVIKVNNNNFVMVDNWDPADPYFLRLEK